MAIGLYGKLPSQGDFVSRRLPWDFTEAWDHWLQAGLHQAREALGPQWLARYLTAPIWRFRLAPGVVGASGWTGLWFPSVDRVGRHFPLTLAAPFAAAEAARYAPLLLPAWDADFLALEDQALQALDPKCPLQHLDQALQSWPWPPSAAADPSRQGLAAGATVQAGSPQEPGPVSHPGEPGLRVFDPAANAAEVAAEVAADTRLAGDPACVFFTWGGDQLPPAWWATPALPAPALFARFLVGPGGLSA